MTQPWNPNTWSNLKTPYWLVIYLSKYLFPTELLQMFLFLLKDVLEIFGSKNNPYLVALKSKFIPVTGTQKWCYLCVADVMKIADKHIFNVITKIHLFSLRDRVPKILRERNWQNDKANELGCAYLEKKLHFYYNEV